MGQRRRSDGSNSVCLIDFERVWWFILKGLPGSASSAPDAPINVRDDSMKNRSARFTRGFEGMRSHYDFERGVRGKHAPAFAEGTNRVLLDADVARVVTDFRSVNTALRATMPIIGLSKARRRKAG
jgi:hypothetical protein